MCNDQGALQVTFAEHIKHTAMETTDQSSKMNPFNENVTSGFNPSPWFEENKKPLSYSPLSHDIDTDVLVIGGGISGLTTAYCLAKEGRQVILLEDGNIGSGETGRTTAHLTCALDDRYVDLEKIFDKKTAQLAANSHMTAIEWIDRTVTLNAIDCHFRRLDGYLFLHPSDKLESLEEEYEATKRAGLLTEMVTSIPGIAGGEQQNSIRFSKQGQFHILMYLEGLAKAFINAGGTIHTQTKAENITSEGAKANGFSVKANHIVVATNTPVNDWVTMHTKQWPYRTYAIAAKIPKGSLPYALWWDTGDQDSKWISKPYHYARLEEFTEEHDLLIAGGEDHRTGQADDESIDEEDRYGKLLIWAKQHFPSIGSIEYKWSGQVLEPIDSLAYIGRNPGDENIYIITGDSGNGMTHGTLGGMIITDIILERDNPWISLYSPSRITLKTTGHYLKEVGNMVAQFGDWFGHEDISKTDELKPGEGGILSDGFRKLAVYCDENNTIHTCSAVCPHLGAILQWNDDEKTFDCPMHGSRFTTDGKVINGPAISDLKKIDYHPASEKKC